MAAVRRRRRRAEVEGGEFVIGRRRKRRRSVRRKGERLRPQQAWRLDSDLSCSLNQLYHLQSPPLTHTGVWWWVQQGRWRVRGVRAKVSR